LKTIVLTLPDIHVDLSEYGEVVSRDTSRVTLQVPKSETSRVTARLLAELPVSDLTVEDPPIDDVIEHVFAHPEMERA
jgi:ABC-2 type transport system ATP-binding protein